MFDGKKIRDEILKGLADKIVLMSRHPILAEILIGNDSVSKQYAELKKKMAEKTGIIFNIYTFSDKNDEQEIAECIDFLNQDDEVAGIMIQIPVSKKFDRDKLISKISPDKDVDGLRFCLGLESEFKPPVVLAILEALYRSNVISTASVIPAPYQVRGKTPAGIHKTIFGSQINLPAGRHGSGMTKKRITIVGKGFLVGNPLVKVLKKQGLSPIVISSEGEKSHEIPKQVRDDILNSDIVISATGKAGIIQPEMIKEGVVLIDAGTAEENGEQRGDIDPECYKKASYYTPVPGGIGPVTVAMLFRNLISK